MRRGAREDEPNTATGDPRLMEDGPPHEDEPLGASGGPLRTLARQRRLRALQSSLLALRVDDGARLRCVMPRLIVRVKRPGCVRHGGEVFVVDRLEACLLGMLLGL